MLSPPEYINVHTVKFDKTGANKSSTSLTHL